MTPARSNALQVIDAVIRKNQSLAERLAEVCRVLQALPHYTGVYLYVLEGDTLVLNAFHGRVTEHTHIPSWVGICGSSVQTRAPVTVADVALDSRYLACNLETKSEIVFPIVRGERYLAQIDVDSDTKAAFGVDDENFLAQVAKLLEPIF